MQCTCNEILGRVGKIIAAVKIIRNNNYEFLCSYYCLNYPVCKAHAQYYIDISELSVYTISLIVST